MTLRAAALALVLAAASSAALDACTAFCAVGGGQVLVGNNEDWHNPRTKIWFVPAAPGAFGRMYTGFDDMAPQGGMNDRGLWFDGFAMPPEESKSTAHLPYFQGAIIDAAMAQCATVEEVIQLFSRYNRGFLRQAAYMFADASGDAVTIESNAIVRKKGKHFVQTNFHQSRGSSSDTDARFRTANAMLADAGEAISVDVARRILSATHQKGGSPTLYSNVYDLRARTMHLYYFHDFERAVTFDLAAELAKGPHTLDIPSLFPPNAAATQFESRRGAPADAAVWHPMFVLPIVVGAVLLVGVALVRFRHRWRAVLAVFAVTTAAIVGAVALTLESARPSNARWLQFTIGPPTGDSAWVGSSTIEASGVTMRRLIAIAHDVRPPNVIGPAWLDQSRYSLRAVASVDRKLQDLLREELEHRLRLEARMEKRPFDVLVLTAGDAPKLMRARGMTGRSTWLHPSGAVVQTATMTDLATALQFALNRTVLDETGLAGTFDFEFDWSADRLASLTATLRDRFGLNLAEARRELDVLVVDRIDRDAALRFFDHAAGLTRALPASWRREVAGALSVR